MKKLVVAVLAGLAAAFATTGGAEANTCRALEMQLTQLQFRSGAGRQAAAMRNLLIDRGCRGGRRAKAAEPRTRSERLARRERSEERARPARQARRERPAERAKPARQTARRATKPEEAVPASTARGETYRTLCVRTCDGYYFPISFSTSRQHFDTDRATCQAMCPASDTALYYHEVPGQGPEDMLSLDGAAYTSLPTAFRHRNALDKSCTCTSPRPAAERLLTAQVRGTVEAAPAPSARPEPGEDPESLANRLGRFVPQPRDRAVAGAPTGPGRAVRDVTPPAPSVSLLTAVPN